MLTLKSDEFQFPSNGKVYSELIKSSKPILLFGFMFQFPSNGKVYSEAFRGV